VHATLIVFAVSAVKSQLAEPRPEPIEVTMAYPEPAPNGGANASAPGGESSIPAAPVVVPTTIGTIAPTDIDKAVIPIQVTIWSGDLARQFAGQGTQAGRTTDFFGVVGQDSLSRVEPPVPIQLADPLYPSSLKAAGVEGSVTIEFVIGTNGSADSSSVQIIAADFDAFGESARDAVLQSRFRPGRSNGVPVRVRVRQMVRFLVK
jgi:TonB family protein